MKVYDIGMLRLRNDRPDDEHVSDCDLRGISSSQTIIPKSMLLVRPLFMEGTYSGD